MGVDLRLLPLDAWFPGAPAGATPIGWGYSHTILTLPRDRDAWPAFETLPQTPLGVATITSHIGGRGGDGQPTYGDLTEDAYGQPYKMVRAADLAPLLARFWPGHPTSEYIRALAKYSPDRPVVLDWH